MLKEIPQDWIASKYEGRSVTLKNGSIIELKGADNPDSLRGIKLQGLIIDEIASIRNWDWLWHEVLRATLADFKAPAIFISTPKGYNHFYTLFTQGQDGKDNDFKSWRFTSYDNKHVPKEEIDKVKEELDENYFAQEYLADFRSYTGRVYQDFQRTLHVKELADFEPVYYMRGVDRGYTNPTAVPIIAVGKDGTWYQTHELYKTKLTTSLLDNELKALDLIAGVKEYEYETMDSEASGDIAELNSMGYSFIPVIKTSKETNVNYVRFKISRMADRLRVRADTDKPRYYVHPRCTSTIFEFENYAYPEEKDMTKNATEQPMKLNDHMMDALADLNVMYEHYYKEKERQPWDGKIPGTYIRPSPVKDDETEQGDWAEVSFSEEVL